MSRNPIAIDDFPVSIVFAINLETEMFKLMAKVKGGIQGEVPRCKGSAIT